MHLMYRDERVDDSSVLSEYLSMDRNFLLDSLFFLLTGSVCLQADNQLLQAERWPVLYVKSRFSEDSQQIIEPALKVELQWTPMPTYHSFEVYYLVEIHAFVEDFKKSGTTKVKDRAVATVFELAPI